MEGTKYSYRAWKINDTDKPSREGLAGEDDSLSRATLPIIVLREMKGLFALEPPMKGRAMKLVTLPVSSLNAYSRSHCRRPHPRLQLGQSSGAEQKRDDAAKDLHMLSARCDHGFSAPCVPPSPQCS